MSKQSTPIGDYEMNDYGNNEKEVLSQVNSIFIIVNEFVSQFSDINEKLDNIDDMLTQHTFQLDEIRAILETCDFRKTCMGDLRKVKDE